MKRAITPVIILCLMFSLCSVYAESAGEYIYRNENGNAVICSAPVDSEGCIHIPSTVGGLPVTGVDDWAFDKNLEITSVIFDNGITKIGDGAFSGCQNLESVILPDTLLNIGWDAFSYCRSLESMEIPDKVKSLGGFSFCGCTALKSLKIGRETVRIGYGAFKECENLSRVYYPLEKTDRAVIDIKPENDVLNTVLWYYGDSQKGVRPGDINGDSNVDNKDLTRLFQYLSDWGVEINSGAVDVNADGSEDNKDLTRLFQFLSDWDVEIY